MKHLAQIILITLMALIPCGCSQPHEGAFHSLHNGMTRQQVRELLGEPSTTFYETEKSRGEVDNVYEERWQYGDNFSTRATGAIFPENAPDRVWVIYFDAQGRVSGFREPLPDEGTWRNDVK